MQALFLAKGWRHDVEPMAFLASAFQKQHQDLQVDFVTYRVHKVSKYIQVCRYMHEATTQ